MDKSMETILMGILVLLIVLAIWYFYFRKEKCSASKPCKKANEVCGSDGYCQASKSA